jgi:hypothetical protein
MDILEIARNSGLLVTLDGKIGREEYPSVYGSVQALERFVLALRMRILDEACIRSSAH